MKSFEISYKIKAKEIEFEKQMAECQKMLAEMKELQLEYQKAKIAEVLESLNK